MSPTSGRKAPFEARIKLETGELGDKCAYASVFEFGGTLCLVSGLTNIENGETYCGYCGEVICPFCDLMPYRRESQ